MTITVRVFGRELLSVSTDTTEDQAAGDATATASAFLGFAPDQGVPYAQR